MIKSMAEIEVALRWDRLRRLLRFGILCGDVAQAGHDWAAWGPGGTSDGAVKGLDSGRRLEYWDVLRALWQLKANDPLGYELLRRHVGYHCEGTRCRPIDGKQPALGHWHQVSLADLRSRLGQKQDYLQARRDAAMSYVVEFCGDS